MHDKPVESCKGSFMVRKSGDGIDVECFNCDISFCSQWESFRSDAWIRKGVTLEEFLNYSQIIIDSHINKYLSELA